MMYTPNLGRWLQEDPILFEGGDQDLYRFVKNNPVNRVDPSGLAEPLNWLTGFIYVGANDTTLWLLNKIKAHEAFYNQAIKPALQQKLNEIMDRFARIGLKGCYSAKIVAINKLRISSLTITPSLKAIHTILGSDTFISSAINAYLFDFQTTWNTLFSNPPTETVSNCPHGKKCNGKWVCHSEDFKIDDFSITDKANNFLPKHLKVWNETTVAVKISASIRVELCSAQCC